MSSERKGYIYNSVKPGYFARPCDGLVSAKEDAHVYSEDDFLAGGYSGHVQFVPLTEDLESDTVIYATGMPTEAAKRKAIPLATGCVDYFPDALAAVAELSRIGNDQHNPGQPLHWDRAKSTDEADALMRHFIDRGKLDSDGVRHSAKVAWRALALLQKEIEAARGL